MENTTFVTKEQLDEIVKQYIKKLKKCLKMKKLQLKKDLFNS